VTSRNRKSKKKKRSLPVTPKNWRTTPLSKRWRRRRVPLATQLSQSPSMIATRMIPTRMTISINIRRN